MAHPILPDEPEDKTKTVQPMIQADRKDHPSWFDRLLTLMVAWQYFHWTGKAIANGKKLPKDWVNLRKVLLPKSVDTVIHPEEKKPKTSFKVVDMTTKEPIRIQ